MSSACSDDLRFFPSNPTVGNVDLSFGGGLASVIFSWCPNAIVGYGFSLVGLPSLKCEEQILLSAFGFQLLLADDLLTFFIHILLACLSLASVGNGKRLNGGSHMHRPNPKLHWCLTQNCCFHFFSWYPPLLHPTTQQYLVDMSFDSFEGSNKKFNPEHGS